MEAALSGLSYINIKPLDLDYSDYRTLGFGDYLNSHRHIDLWIIGPLDWDCHMPTLVGWGATGEITSPVREDFDCRMQLTAYEP